MRRITAMCAVALVLLGASAVTADSASAKPARPMSHCAAC